MSVGGKVGVWRPRVDYHRVLFCQLILAQRDELKKSNDPCYFFVLILFLVRSRLLAPVSVCVCVRDATSRESINRNPICFENQLDAIFSLHYF